MDVTALPVGQIGLGEPTSDLLNMIVSLIWMVPWLLILFFPGFSQRLQMRTMMMDVERKLAKLKIIRDDVKERTVETIKSVGKPTEDPREKIEKLMEFFIIQPESMDPYGFVGKLDHVLRVGENRFESEVRALTPAAKDNQVKNLSSLVDISRSINTVYRIIRHFYLLGKKTANIYLILQLQMLMPQMMESTEALRQASYAYARGQPIGDGVGVLVVATISRGKEKNRKEVAKDTIVSEMDLEERRILVVRALGPGATVGRPGEAVEKLVKKEKNNIQLIITVDGTLKLEGEKTGKISEGVGVAIGGPGVDKYKIEQVARKHGIPTHAIVINESILEAITPMREGIVKAVDHTVKRVKEIIMEMTQGGSTVILAGIGNTSGIG